MHLQMTSGDIRDAAFIDEHGHALYRTSTPHHFFDTGTTSITKALPPNKKHGSATTEIAQIEWEWFRQAEFHINGQTIDAKDFMQSSGILFSKDYTFSAPDGRSYRWSTHLSSCRLEAFDGSTIAEGSGGSSGLLGTMTEGFLDISPGGYHILDAIIITFAFVEGDKQRKKRAARRAA
ncbi:hypothetical protein CONPUDRAFT_73130 [Coniophora puteana RWD-64-598 SS2]|uniref:DUF6593 domain-containing protein n=1 Tax=Coniophora puteana (strain RWD-64-598) TaxID=741705 RepID=A0A5M3MQP7_CONPW|nr:uncharacterized protein CONPUDRAFT_73130 [Coniophora puteana RWD-64-598 SS2]EIW81387.1 hypothetical protein CONPUDRAFT_73130 [Coniophora puteana RWD-64-598 SS2]